MKKNIFLIPIIIVTLLLSCNERRTFTRKYDQAKLPEYMVNIDTSTMKQSFLSIVRSYTQSFPQYSTFLIVDTKFVWNPSHSISNGPLTNSVYEIGPAYDHLFNHGEWGMYGCYPTEYFELDGKIIFLSGATAALHDQQKYSAVYSEYAIKRSKEDSLQSIDKYRRESEWFVVEHFADKAFKIECDYTQFDTDHKKFTPPQ